MCSHSEVEKTIDDLARKRILEYFRVDQRSDKFVVTLVDIAEETALDPNTVETVMAQFEIGSDTSVRRATADQLRWHIHREGDQTGAWRLKPLRKCLLRFGSPESCPSMTGFVRTVTHFE